MARPSRALIMVPQPAGHSRQVLAYHRGTPGSVSSGATRYGISFSGGAAQPAVAAPASPTPTSLRKSLLSKTTPSLIGPLVVAHQAVHARRVRGVVEILAVAGHTPPHLERRVLVDHRHLLHRTVAGLARDAGLDVALVVVLHVGRQLVDLGTVAGGDLVAAHARAHRRQVRDRGLLGAVVAVQTVHAELSGMELVAEIDRLRGAALVPEVLNRERLRESDGAGGERSENGGDNQESFHGQVGRGN